MGYITRYGSFWGLIPHTSGRIFWVSPADTYTVEGRSYSASDNNDGLSPERALRTIDYAVGLTTANANDVIVLLPGAHSSAATITLDIAGITLTGLPGSPPVMGSRMPGGPARNRTSIVNTATAGVILTISADDVEVAWIDFLPVAAGGRGITNSIGADRTYIHDCSFALVATAATSTYGVAIGGTTTGATNDVVIRNCHFVSGLTAANGGGVEIIGTAYGTSIENCTFQNKGTGAWARAIETLNAASMGIHIRDCDFLNSSNTTSVITTAVFSASTVDGSTTMYRCYVDAGTDVATASAIVDIVMAETYLASSGGGALANNN